MPTVRILRRAARLGLLFLLTGFVYSHDIQDQTTPRAHLATVTRNHAFNYVEWEIGAILSKASQELFGFHAYIPETNRKQVLLDYFASPDPKQQALIEHIIEGQVSAVLADEGFAALGQVLPPVTMRFLTAPNVMVVSPRHEIRQEQTITLGPLTDEERVTLEQAAEQAAPDYAVWITRVGGVGVWPAMVMETQSAVTAFEITAHEWAHHYLIFFPLGINYYSSQDTRIINETVATIFGLEMGNAVIERYYADELISGQVGLQAIPDYRALLAALQGNNLLPSDSPFSRTLDSARLTADYLLSVGKPHAAQIALDVRNGQFRTRTMPPNLPPTAPRSNADQGGWIHHTRVATDYLLTLGRVPAAELVMENGRQHAGLRALNQAWFAFNVGYQANPIVQTAPDGTPILTTAGGGGDPIGAAIYEIRARSDSLLTFMQHVRGVTTREGLFALVERLRADTQ